MRSARGWLDSIPAKIDVMNVPGPEAAAMKKAYNSTLPKSRGMIDNAWNANKKLALELTNLLTALKDSKGWSVVKDANGKEVFDFTDVAIATAFTQRVAKLEALANDQQQTMADMMTALRETIAATFSAVPPPTPTPTVTPTPAPPGSVPPPGAPTTVPVVTPTPVPPPR